MGRQARAPKKTTERIVLDPADYWKLMKLEQDVQIATLQAKRIVSDAQTARAHHAHALSLKYPAFKAEDAHYRAEDATCSLIRELKP